jgi:hypothetical protein
MLRGETIEEKLKWARENIDAHAVMRFSEPPGRFSETKWSVTRVDGCAVELKQAWQRTAPEGASEARVIRYSFDLRGLSPGQVQADTSIGLPHLKIFATGDVFHRQTDFTSRKRGSDKAESWSVAGNDRNLWMYFDSPTANNRALVRRLARDLRAAVAQCGYQR